MSDIEEFRQETRDWLENNCPESMRTPPAGVMDHYFGGRNPEMRHPDEKVWCDRMSEKGWTAPGWPREYGGGGLSKEECKVLSAEMQRLGARKPLVGMGVSMLGPALLKYGSEAQRMEHLPRICRGEIRWCQGYSEPNAGSDLASLQTRAEDQGDHYAINGQKIWTSSADKSDWIFCLVRTDNTGTKHDGISFVLIDMDQPGVTTKPIRLISGASPFCETFLDNARAEKHNLVGEAGKGWSVAKYLLTHEREMVADFLVPPTGKSLGETAIDVMGGDGSGRLVNGVLRHKLARYELDRLAFEATTGRIGDEVKAGQGLGPASSVVKYFGTELNKRRQELLLAVFGEEALGWEGEMYQEGRIPRDWLRSKGNSIEGGTSEVQLNIIAKRVLNLPQA